MYYRFICFHYMFLYIYLLRDGYATGSSILPLFSSYPLLAVSVAFTRLSHGSFSLFLFSQLSPLFFLFPLSMFVSLYPRFPTSLFSGYFSLLDRNSATLYIRHTLVYTTCKKYQKIVRFRLIIGKRLNWNILFTCYELNIIK